MGQQQEDNGSQPQLNGLQSNGHPSRESCWTIDELLRTKAAGDPDQQVVFYPKAGIDYIGYTASQLDTFAFRAATEYLPEIKARQSSNEAPTVVALLGVSNLDYIVTLLAISKLGHTILLLSPRLTKEAYTRLLQDTGAKFVVCQPEHGEKVEDIPGTTIIPISTQDGYGNPTPTQESTNLTPGLDLTVESTNPIWIFHSSGSTGLPKPVPLTQRGALANYQRNIEKLTLRCFSTLPLFHTHGMGSLFRAIITGRPVYFYNASLPLTKDYLIESLERHHFELFSVVPYALKLLSESSKGIELLKKLELVTFGGSPCPDSLGNMLAEAGVHLVSVYGMSETGPLMMSTRPRSDKSWNYLRPTAEAKPYLTFEPREGGTYELVCLPGLPSKSMSNRDDGSYATKDLFVKHPSLEAWKYCGRNDDIVVLENGEKVNPVDIEGAVTRHELVSAAVVFGTGKPYPGMLVIPSSAAGDIAAKNLLDLVWPTIEAAQVMTPDYAKMSRDMVIILPPNTPYPKTDKDSVIRKRFYVRFSKEIDDYYSSTETAGTVVSLNKDEILSLVRTGAEAILSPRQVSDDADFFALGMNSLQAAQLRNFILKKVGGPALGLNVVFEHPSVRSLAEYMSSDSQDPESASLPDSDKINQMIEKYSQFAQHQPRPRTFESQGQYVVLTGSTGSLGAHLLRTLILDPQVRMVYCLVRAASVTDARHRVFRSLHTRKLYFNIPRAVREKIVCVPADFSSPSLGLSPELYDRIARQLTVVYHCAWAVNFNLRLESLERDCIAGVKNLIDLCLSAHGPHPATFSFLSSIGTVLRTKEKTVPESLPTSPSNSQPTGYALSKFVAEHVCMNAAARVGIPVYINRIGQIVGDTVHGIWNSSEAIPLLMQSATTIHSLPSFDEMVRWLPVDVVAKIVVEITTSGAASGVFNIVNPHGVSWTHDIVPYLRQAGLDFELVDPPTWLKRLQEASNPEENPPVKLFEYFKRQFSNVEPRRAVVFETGKSLRWSRTFAAAQAPDQALVAKMVQQFIATAWTSSKAKAPCRSVVAFSGSVPSSLGGAELDALELVVTLISMQLGIPVLDSKSAGFGPEINGTGHLDLHGEKGPEHGPILTIVDRDHIRGLSSGRTRFLVLPNPTESSSATEGNMGDETIDIIPLTATTSSKDLVEEATFWIRDFLEQGKSAAV